MWIRPVHFMPCATDPYDSKFWKRAEFEMTIRRKPLPYCSQNLCIRYPNPWNKKMRNTVLSALFGLFLIVPIAGCSEDDKGPRTVPAEGVVTLDGQPIEGAAVVFIDDGGQYPARARSDAEGKFSLSAFEYKTGAVPGAYKVIVTRTVVGKAASVPEGEESEHAGEAAGETVINDLPHKYSQPTGELAFTIPEDGVTDMKIELTSD